MAWLRRPQTVIALVAVGVFSVYLATLSPTFGTLDHAEFPIVAKTLGIPHPPGFPLYVLLGHLFTYLPFHSVAWRVNLLSVVCAALTVALLGWWLFQFTRSRLGAIAGMLWLAFAFDFWSEAVVADVFALYGLLTVSVSYACWRWTVGGDERHRERWWWAAAGLFGLGLANQPMILVLAPGLALWIWGHRRKLPQTPRAWGLTVLWLMVGLSLYLYLPLRARMDPFISWGDPSTLDRLWAFVTRREFGMVSLNIIVKPDWHPVAIAERLWLVSYLLRANFWWIGLGLAAVGCLRLWHVNRRFWGYALVVWVVTGLVPALLIGIPSLGPGKALGEYDGYLWCVVRLIQPLLLITALWCGIASAWSLELIRRWGARWPRPFRSLAAGLTILVLLVSPSAQATRHWRGVDASRNSLAEDYVRNILRSLESNALVIAFDITATFGIWYLQGVEGLRRDVTVVMLNIDPAGVRRSWYEAQVRRRQPMLFTVPPTTDPAFTEAVHAAMPDNAFLADLILRNIDQRPCYLLGVSGVLFPYSLPNGFAYRLVRTRDDAMLEEAVRQTDRWLIQDPRFRNPLQYAAYQRATDRWLVYRVGVSRYLLGRYWLELEPRLGAEAVTRAVACWESIVNGMGPLPEAYLALASVANRQGDTATAQQYLAILTQLERIRWTARHQADP